MVVLIKDQKYTPNNVLITGGCGFIGSNFINFIHKKWLNTNFVNVDKLILNSDINFVDETVRNSNRYKLVLADIKNSQIISYILNKNKVIFFSNCLFLK